jgi:hypothetical protein
MKGELPKLQSSWESPYEVVTSLNMVYSIQWNLRSRLMVVHLVWLTTYQGVTQDKQHEQLESNHCKK